MGEFSVPKKPLKRYSPNRFTHFDDSFRGSNEIRKAKKIGKDNVWYKKQYTRTLKVVKDSEGHQITPYEVEAISSEFYRFILSTDRAAKARVESPDKEEIEHSQLFIYSQENTSGFRNYTAFMNYFDKRRAEIREKLLSHGFIAEINDGIEWICTPESGWTKELFNECGEQFREYQTTTQGYPQQVVEEYLMKNQFTLDAGFYDLQLARRILNEGDTNFQNVGLNNHGEVSIIDYDFTFYDILKNIFERRPSLYDTIRHKSISELFSNAESELMHNTKALDRFYLCQLRTILLTNTQIISSRHTLSKDLQNEINSSYLKNINELKEALMNSIEFKKFISTRIDINSLMHAFQIYFKHEKKNNIEAYEKCMSSLNENYQTFYNELLFPEKKQIQIIDEIKLTPNTPSTNMKTNSSEVMQEASTNTIINSSTINSVFLPPPLPPRSGKNRNCIEALLSGIKLNNNDTDSINAANKIIAQLKNATHTLNIQTAALNDNDYKAMKTGWLKVILENSEFKDLIVDIVKKEAPKKHPR